MQNIKIIGGSAKAMFTKVCYFYTMRLVVFHQITRLTASALIKIALLSIEIYGYL